MSMTPSMTQYHDGRLVVWGGDCLTLMAALPADSVDAIVTDPPYGLGFMGKKWDDLPPGKEWAEACYRVLKPGGHVLAFGGTRTWHRLAVAIEDGGFEIRDSLAWLYGSGFPKSMDVAKAIDKAQGIAGGQGPMKRGGERLLRQAPGGARDGDGTWGDEVGRDAYTYAPGGEDAQQWEGWGTALKPAFEPIVVGRKPLGEKTVAANVLVHGTGALNIDATRIEHGSNVDLTREQRQTAATSGMKGLGDSGFKADHVQPLYAEGGRWPANVILDESQTEALDEQSGTSKSRRGQPRAGVKGDGWRMTATGAEHDDIGGASRFFYCAKAPKSERPVVELTNPDGSVTKVAHPTVKPVALMRWLVRLVTPPDGLVLDTFAGTGTTGEACVLEGFRCLLAEDPTKGEQDYLPLIDQRITRAVAQLPKTEPMEQTA